MNYGGTDNSVKELPHMIKVTGMTFIPIQKFIPAKADSLIDPRQKYIALANNGKTTNYSNNYKSYSQGGSVITIITIMNRYQNIKELRNENQIRRDYRG